MKVTRDGFKDRQLHMEDYLQMVSAKQKENAEVSVYQRITENNDIITNFWTDNLLELILQKDNLNKAYKKVKSNKGKGGIDGMQVDRLLPYLREHQSEIVRQIREGKYKPNPVRGVEIPKEEKGKIRKLGIPTVADRVIQQAIPQELTALFEPQISDGSYGFRPGRGQHDALKACKRNVEEGYSYVVSMDLEKFFDTVNHSKLIETLSRTIKDGRVKSLIHKYLNAGMVQNGYFEKTQEGVPQGGPLSPLCGNVILNELDKELERRGHRFVRYADDAIIFCRSRRSAQRTLEKIIPYIEGKLYLKVNRAKTKVTHISRKKYLGYAFYRNRGKCRYRIAPETVRKMKDRLREMTQKNKGWSNACRRQKLETYVRGWINYYKLADMKRLMTETDEWLRRRIRAVYWKQWKKIKTRYRNLGALKLEEWQVHQLANSRKGYWRTAKMLNIALTNKVIARLGYIGMSDYYLKVCEN
ncbi:group II intron reverse transcriptase/maturase [Lachnospiraceae bacterium 54-53]